MFLLRFLLLVLSVSAQKIYRLFYLDNRIALTVGSPPQPLFGLPILTNDEIVVVDRDCGNYHGSCPRYCSNAEYRDLYCNAECNNKSIGCQYNDTIYDKLHYSPDNSTTVVFLNQSWRNHLGFYSQQFGRFVQDAIEFPLPHHKNEETLKMTEFEFVDGLYLDSRFMRKASAAIGLASGANNFIMKLFAQKRIPESVISIASEANDITIGGYNKEYCTNWINKNASSTRWILTFDSATFCDQNYSSDVVVTFDLSTEQIFIPDSKFQKLVDTKIVLFSMTSKMYNIQCNASLNLHFSLDNHDFELTSSALIRMNRQQKSCYTPIAPLSDWYQRPRIYYDEPNWILGRTFLAQCCLAFNYETNQIAISNSVHN